MRAMKPKTFVSLLVLLASLGFAHAQIGGCVDVTNRIKAAVSGNSVKFLVTNDSMGGDPAVKLPKKLKVEYTVDGVPKTKLVMESAKLVIDIENGKKLAVTKAVYGNVAEKYTDVTAILAAAVKNNVLTIKVGNRTLGGDPAYNAAKQLQVSYTLDGKPFTASASEEEVVTLPASGIGVLVIVDAKYGSF